MTSHSVFIVQVYTRFIPCQYIEDTSLNVSITNSTLSSVTIINNSTCDSTCVIPFQDIPGDQDIQVSLFVRNKFGDSEPITYTVELCEYILHIITHIMLIYTLYVCMYVLERALCMLVCIAWLGSQSGRGGGGEGGGEQAAPTSSEICTITSFTTSIRSICDVKICTITPLRTSLPLVCTLVLNCDVK